MSPALWEEVSQPNVDLVIFEGWCVGFRALDVADLEGKWRRAVERKDETSKLWRCNLEEIRFVNERLREYDALTRCVRCLRYELSAVDR